MTKERVLQLQKKENIQLEFKEANNKLQSSLFETICAMLNRSGGDLIPGVDNNGNITGIENKNILVGGQNQINNIVEFIGEPKAKTSGYFLTEDFKKNIKHE